ncbi:MAG: hypothetical protein WCJ84_05620 [Candidatus Peregrinibacteria bacterium]
MPKTEEISADEVEVVPQGEEEEVLKIQKIRVSGDDETLKNPLEQFAATMEELKKIKPYGFISLIVGLLGIFTLSKIFCPLAMALGAIDLWQGSEFTKKIAIAGIILGILGLLNTL